MNDEHAHRTPYGFSKHLSTHAVRHRLVKRNNRVATAATIPLSFRLPSKKYTRYRRTVTIQWKSSELCICISAGRQPIHPHSQTPLYACRLPFVHDISCIRLNSQTVSVCAFFTLSDRKICWLLPWWKWFCVFVMPGGSMHIRLLSFSSEGVCLLVCHWNWKSSGGHYLDCMQSKYIYAIMWNKNNNERRRKMENETRPMSIVEVETILNHNEHTTLTSPF